MTSFMAPRVGIVLHGWSVKVLELVFARSFMMEGIQGLVNFVPAVAYHFCLNFPETFPQPGVLFLAQPCTSINDRGFGLSVYFVAKLPPIYIAPSDDVTVQKMRSEAAN